MSYRTHNCGELRLEDKNKSVILSGWVQKSRRLGQMVFVDLRDKTGITQIIFPADSKFIEQANSLRSEYVIKVSGLVVKRKSKNPEIKTGDIEILVENLNILSKAKTTPLIIANETDALEDIRMKYRYLDLRRNPVRENIELRHNLITSIRNFLNNEKFLDIDTPILTKATPEGARNFLVPSRVNKNKFYALPQSPQLFKQLLMIGGIEKYYQIAKCFRDEDLRSDRQPEFTQLDIEASFLKQEEFQKIIEKLMQHVLKETKNIKIKLPIEKISYENAMNRFGTDKPDTRFGIELNDVTTIFKNSEFKVFANADMINVIAIPKLLDKKQIAKAEYIAKEYGAKGLAWSHIENGKIKSPIAKFCEKELLKLVEKLKIKENSTLLFVADKKNISQTALGSVRKFVADMLQIPNSNEYKLLWVEKWPLFELDEENNLGSMHHPFTSPTEETKKMIITDPLKVEAQAYDMVLNGYEIGGGSVRIFEQELQKDVFNVLGLNKQQIEEQFGFFTEALEYGVPPHCGIAFGIDRIAMLLSNNARSIKDVIAFPKNASAVCTMTNAPTIISDDELKELNIKVGK